MSPTPFAEQERALLIELADLFAFRAGREKDLAARLRRGLADAGALHKAAAEQARQTFDQSSHAASAAARKAQAEIDGAAAAELEGATRAMTAELGAFQTHTRALVKTVARRLRESRWLAETMIESGRERTYPAFEATQTAIAKRVERLDAVERDARTALAQRRYAPMPAGSPEPDVDPDGAAPGLGAPAEFDAAGASVREAATGLERALAPPLTGPIGVLLMCLVGAVIGAAVKARHSWTDPAAALPIALPGAGIGIVSALVLLLAYRLIARRAVPPAARRLSEALARARRAAEEVVRSAAAARDAEIASLENMARKEWSGAQASVASLRAEVEMRNSVQEPKLRDRHEKILDGIRAERDRRLAEIGERLDADLAEMESRRTGVIAAADESLAGSRREIEEADRVERAALEADWSGRIAGAMAVADELARVAREISPRWDAATWENAPAATASPPGVRFGSMRLDLAALPGGLSADPRLGVPGPTVRELPLMVDLLGAGSLLLRATPDRRGAAVGVLNNIALRLLTGLPPGKARFTLVDPVGLGQSFAGLMHLSDYEEAIVGERIWTDAAHIEQRLTDLTEHMETVIQKYLRNEYETIQAYNDEAEEVAEPYRFLVIADFPTGFSEGAARRLASIAASGARCGVFMLLMTTQPGARPDAQRRGLAAVPWAEIAASSMVLEVSGAGVRWEEEPFSPLPVALEAPPDEAASARLMHQIGEHVKDSTRVRVPFSIVEPPESGVWGGDAAAELRLPLGRAGAKKLQHLSLGRGTAQHMLIAGRTGSGKSTLLHVIATTAALWYSPDEVELYLVDFKKGVEFKTYAAHRLPHARVVAVESEREFGLSVLRNLDAQMTRRGALFRDAGVQDLASFRRWQARQGGATPMPRILLMVDEFQEFFVEDDKLAQDAGLLLDRLVRQGRAFGVHAILGSQTLGGAYTLARSTLGQMAVRIALQCSEADAYLIMSEDNPAPRLLSRPGEAIYNDASGMVEANSPFQVVWLPDETRDGLLERIRRRQESTGRPPPPQVVFEGNIPGDITGNRPLAELIEGKGAAAPTPVLWLGEPLSIKGPTGISLQRHSAGNALIVGNDESQAAAMVAGAIVSLAAWLRAPGRAGRAAGELCPPIVILDATPPDHPHAGLMPQLAGGLGGMALLAAARQVAGALADVAAVVDRREASGAADAGPVLLIVNGLQRLRELRKSDEFSFGGEAERTETAAQRFTRVLRVGPSVGVHSLVWCDTATNLDRALERQAMREFGVRVLMQMSGGDSTQLIDSAAASMLGRNRALLYHEDTGAVEKFRPYSVPEPGWIGRVLGRIGGPAPE